MLETSAGEWDRVLVLATWWVTAPIDLVIDRIKALPVTALVRGNHDKVARGLDSVETFNQIARQAIEWTARVLTPENVALAGRSAAGTGRGRRADRHLPRRAVDEDAYLFDERDVAGRDAPRVRPLCLFGHTHVPSVFRIGASAEAMLPIRGERCRVSIEAGQRYPRTPAPSASRATATPGGVRPARAGIAQLDHRADAVRRGRGPGPHPRRRAALRAWRSV